MLRYNSRRGREAVLSPPRSKTPLRVVPSIRGPAYGRRLRHNRPLPSSKRLSRPVYEVDADGRVHPALQRHLRAAHARGLVIRPVANRDVDDAAGGPTAPGARRLQVCVSCKLERGVVGAWGGYGGVGGVAVDGSYWRVDPEWELRGEHGGYGGVWD